MKLLTIIGARPQYMKAAVVSRALARARVDEYLVDTGQHYDPALSSGLAAELGLTIAENLAVGSGAHAVQTATMMTRIDALIDRGEPPRGVLVYGDTNSTLAGALVAVKRGIPVFHVEAGLRSFNRTMPEEINRVLVDQVAADLFCPSAVAVENLTREHAVGRIHDVGDVTLDAFGHFGAIAAERQAASAVLAGIAGPLVLATIHRPANTDDPARLAAIVAALAAVPATCLWPLHPRLRAVVDGTGLPGNVRLVAPLSYLETLDVLAACDGVITDSGGLQKEAYWAKRSCVTLRNDTEWVETLATGWNVLADPLHDDVAALLASPRTAERWVPLYGDGHAAERIAGHVAAALA